MLSDIRVLLVDDHAVVRQGYRRLLDQTPGMSVAGEAATGEDGYRLFTELLPDVTVLDIGLPGMGGLETARRILGRATRAKILIFSVHDDAVFSSRALQAGVLGYVSKAAEPDVLVEAVRRVAQGEVYLSHDVAQALAVQVLPGQRNPMHALSPREFEVFRLTVAGREARDIARVLSLSEKTVANYQSAVRQKLGVATLAQAVRLAATHGLFVPPDVDNGHGAAAG